MAELKLSSLLADFLRNPVVEVHISDSKEVLALRARLEQSEKESQRAAFQYGQEVSRNLRYEDFLREHGFDPKQIR